MVSIIIACYNKALWIDALFESIERQHFKNLEIIVVNDGSTDDSPVIIERWKTKAVNHGYEVKFINQNNLGVAAALKRGLQSATGDYVCFPDADDELDKEYASSMVDLMENDKSIDYVICDVGYRNELGGEVFLIDEDCSEFNKGDLAVRYMFQRFFGSVCRFLIRKSYLISLGFPDCIATEPRETQEPQILIPVLSGNGKFIKLNKMLYIYNRYASEQSKKAKISPIEKPFGKIYNLQLQTIMSLSIAKEEKYKLASLIGLSCTIISNQLLHHNIEENTRLRAIQNKLLKENPHNIRGKFNRAIAYGALGKNAKHYLSAFINTHTFPKLLWDNKATDEPEIINGVSVTKPKPELLQDGDCIICFATVPSAIEEVRLLAQKYNISYIEPNEILDCLSSLLYPDSIYEGNE